MDINKITVKEHLIGTLRKSTKSTSEKYFQDYLNNENMLNILFDLLISLYASSYAFVFSSSSFSCS